MRRRLLFWGFKSSQELFESSLGTLEREAMALVWDRGEISVRDACDVFPSPIAYTTMMTTLDRLFRKGLLSRRKVGRAFLYQAAASRAEMEGAVASELVQSLLERNGEALPILSSLVDAVSDRDRELLGALERLIREKRRTMGRERSS